MVTKMRTKLIHKWRFAQFYNAYFAYFLRMKMSFESLTLCTLATLFYTLVSPCLVPSYPRLLARSAYTSPKLTLIRISTPRTIFRTLDILTPIALGTKLTTDALHNKR